MFCSTASWRGDIRVLSTHPTSVFVQTILMKSFCLLACVVSLMMCLGGCAAKYSTSPGPPGTSGLSSIQHIVILVQENRSLDHYLGALRGYWAANGYPDQSFDGLPQFNPVSGAAPLRGPAPATAGCDPNFPPPGGCVFDPNVTISSFHLLTQCVEDPSPSWDEGHRDWDYDDPTGLQPAKMNGFVYAAGEDARNNVPPFHDLNGVRGMGYYDGSDLNYEYFMASNFATSDRWFNPVMSRSQPNHEYLIAATSQGYVYPNGTDSQDQALLTAKTIFEELQDAGISWKIYVDPEGSSCTGPPYNAACLMKLSYVQAFTFGQKIVSQYPQNIAPVSQYFADLQNGTLPQVAEIEPATDAGLDEHPTAAEQYPTNLQSGEEYVATLINGLMQSSSWKNSAFFLTYDEGGGFYDHVPPQPAVSPDGIKPVDLLPNDICTAVTGTGPLCDFTWTGFRVPLVVISPYAKKNYVSHTVADYTAILKFIETRFNLPPLTKRDAAQMDMTEFFDFNAPPWMTPPTPPEQNTSGPCYADHLP
jgi:phospholipase C